KGRTEEAGDHEDIEAVQGPEEGAEHGKEFHVALAHGFLAEDDGADQADGPEQSVADGGAGAGIEQGEDDFGEVKVFDGLADGVVRREPEGPDGGEGKAGEHAADADLVGNDPVV